VASDQAVRDLEPLVRRVAGSAHRGMPASADIEDVRQVARIAGWEAAQKFDGRGTLDGFAAQCMRSRIIDWQRTQTPGGRNSPGYQFADVDDDALDDVAAETDHARDIERAQQFDARIRQIPVKHRALAKRILAGDTMTAIAANMGVSESRVSQKLAETVAHLQVVPPRVSGHFDPAAVIIRMGSMPRPKVRVNKYRQLLERMPATGSVVLHPAAASALCSEFKRASIPYMRHTLPSGQVEVWREPSPEQRAAARQRTAK